MKTKILILGLVCLFIFTHCKKNLPTSPDLSGVQSLTINYFTATPAEILYGEYSILSWSVSNALKVTIDQDIGEVSTTGTREVSPAETTVYMLTAYGATDTASRTVTVKLMATVVMEGSPAWYPSVYPGGSELSFGFAGRIDKGGALKNIGGETAYSVMMKLTLYDPKGNYITEKYVTFYANGDWTPLGTKVDMQLNMYMNWTCWWVKAENMEIFEQLDATINPYRPDKDPAKCFVITWK